MSELSDAAEALNTRIKAFEDQLAFDPENRIRVELKITADFRLLWKKQGDRWSIFYATKEKIIPLSSAAIVEKLEGMPHLSKFKATIDKTRTDLLQRIDSTIKQFDQEILKC